MLVELRRSARDRLLFTFRATAPTRQDVQQGGHMIKLLLAVAVVVGSFADLAMAQGRQGEAFPSEISPQCAHRRIMAPDPHNDCLRKLRSDAQVGYARGYLGYGRGYLGYGRAQFGYGQAQPGFEPGQPVHEPGQSGHEQPQPGHDQGPGYEQGSASARSLDHRDEGQPSVRREQPKTSTSTSTLPKVATVPAPKAKKASTSPRLDAHGEQQLYQEFLEWRNRRLFYEHVP
jgi:hypothetical protein